MRPSRLLPLLPLLSAALLLACDGDGGGPDAGEDAGAVGGVDAGAVDAGGGTDAGSDAGADAGADAGCDPGPIVAPADLPTLDGRVSADAGDPSGAALPPGFTPRGTSLTGTWAATSVLVEVPGQLAPCFDPAGSSLTGRQWLRVEADGGYAQGIDVTATLATRPDGGFLCGVVPEELPIQGQSRGAYRVSDAGVLDLQPACGAAAKLYFSRPSADAGTQVLVRFPVDMGFSTGTIDVLSELVDAGSDTP